MKRTLFCIFALLLPLGAMADRIDEPAAVTITTTSTPVYAATPNLKDIIISNSGTTACFLSTTGTAVNGRGIYLAGGASKEFTRSNLMRYGPFSAITASGTTTICVSANLTQP